MPMQHQDNGAHVHPDTSHQCIWTYSNHRRMVQWTQMLMVVRAVEFLNDRLPITYDMAAPKEKDASDRCMFPQRPLATGGMPTEGTGTNHEVK